MTSKWPNSGNINPRYKVKYLKCKPILLQQKRLDYKWVTKTFLMLIVTFFLPTFWTCHIACSLCNMVKGWWWPSDWWWSWSLTPATTYAPTCGAVCSTAGLTQNIVILSHQERIQSTVDCSELNKPLLVIAILMCAEKHH